MFSNWKKACVSKPLSDAGRAARNIREVTEDSMFDADGNSRLGLKYLDWDYAAMQPCGDESGPLVVSCPKL